MKVLKSISPLAFAAMLMATLGSCENSSKTYAEHLNDQNLYVNNFLADQRVINSLPADTVFETGPNAPYYRIDQEGNLYMQVVDAGTPGDTVAYNELIYFRFTRYPLSAYSNGEFSSEEGNSSNVLDGGYKFRFGNYEVSSSVQFGSGVQVPLQYLPIDASVNIVVKSQYGFYAEQSYVQPYLYSIRYFRPKI